MFVRLDSNNVNLIGTTVGKQNLRHVWSPYSRIASDMGGTLVVTRQAALATPVLLGTVSSNNAEVSWSAVSGASQYEVEVVDWEQQCDEDWGCNVVNTGVYKYVVTGTTFVDTRGIFSFVIPPGTPGYTYSAVTVTAKHPLNAHFSLTSIPVRFNHQ